MTTLNFPLVICADVPLCQPIVLNFPFGLPPKSFQDPCCVGIDMSLDQLSNVLRPLYPFLQIIGCMLKLVDIITGIPDAIGPPPDPSKIAAVASKLAQFATQCMPYLLSLAPPSPVFILQICQMLRGYTQLLLALLRCLKRVIIVNTRIFADAFVLSSSTDSGLKTMGLCLTTQGNTLSAALNAKLSELTNVLAILNAVIAAIPPLLAILQGQGLYPLTFQANLGQVITDTTAIDALITVLNLVYTALAVCSGGV